MLLLNCISVMSCDFNKVVYHVLNGFCISSTSKQKVVPKPPAAASSDSSSGKNSS